MGEKEKPTEEKKMEGEEDEQENTNTVMCLFTDPEGNPLRNPMFIPQNAGPLQLQEIVNMLLDNVTLTLMF